MAAMPLSSRIWTLLRSLLALGLAIAAIPAVNAAGAWLSNDVFGLPAGGTRRLAVDLFWICMAGLTGTWLMVRTAAVAKTAHAWVLFAIYLAADMYGVITMWDALPHWFTLGVIALLPPQVWLGWWLGGGARDKRS